MKIFSSDPSLETGARTAFRHPSRQGPQDLADISSSHAQNQDYGDTTSWPNVYNTVDIHNHKYNNCERTLCEDLGGIFVRS